MIGKKLSNHLTKYMGTFYPSLP